jgi:hypothetical protein
VALALIRAGYGTLKGVACKVLRPGECCAKIHAG